jgi:hypothetical protein
MTAAFLEVIHVAEEWFGLDRLKQQYIVQKPVDRVLQGLLDMWWSANAHKDDVLDMTPFLTGITIHPIDLFMGLGTLSRKDALRKHLDEVIQELIAETGSVRELTGITIHFYAKSRRRRFRRGRPL